MGLCGVWPQKMPFEDGNSKWFGVGPISVGLNWGDDGQKQLHSSVHALASRENTLIGGGPCFRNRLDKPC